MTAEKKTNKQALKKALLEYIEKTEAFKKEIMDGADFYETAEKYGKKFVAPKQISEEK